MNTLFLCRLGPFGGLSGRLICLFLLTCLQPQTAMALDGAFVCPPANELTLELQAKKAGQIKLKAGLEAFLTGAAGVDMPLTALFSIDLGDADQVEQRANQLRQAIADAPVGGSDPLLACAQAGQESSVIAADILALQTDIARLRLQFFSLPGDKRAAILNPHLQADQQADSIAQLRQAQQTALLQQQQSARTLNAVEQQAITSKSGAEAEWAARRAELERTRSDIAALHLNWLAALKSEAEFYQRTSIKLADIAKFLLQPEPTATLLLQYQACVAIWRQLVDITPHVVSGRFARALPQLPRMPKALTQASDLSAAAVQYRTAFQEAQAFRKELQVKIGTRLQESADLHYRVLLQSGDIRSQLLNTLLDHGALQPLQFSLDLVQDVKREIIIVPFRWTASFYLYWLEVRQQLRQGWEGVAHILRDFALLSGFIGIPWLIWRLGYWVSDKLNRLRMQFVQRSRRHTQAIQLALALQNLQPYAPWLVMLLVLYALQILLALTLFSKLSTFLFYLRYYIYYRLFRLLMQCDFLWLDKQINSGKFAHLRRQINRAAGVIGISSLLMFSLLFAIESLIRRGLVYHFSITVFGYLGLLLGVYFAYQWRSIIALALTRFMPGHIGSRLAKLCNKQWALLFALPSLLLLLLHMLLRIMLGWLGQFDFVRRIAATVFRYQLENAIDKNPAEGRKPLPADYLQGFALEGVASLEQLQQPVLEGMDEIYALLDQWLAGTSAVHSLAIVGDKGVGKTCVLEHLQQRYAGQQVLSVKVPEKLTTHDQVQGFLASALNLSSAKDLTVFADFPAEQEAQAAPYPLTIILLDDAHNLFLATQDGFEGFNTLLTLLTQSSPQVFWCLTFNHHAWSYLNSVKGQQHYFGAVQHLTAWTEAGIQDMILGMHNKTPYRLSYDDILQAAGSQVHYARVAYIENRFFSLLWQQSRGNPRLAVSLWLSALWQVDNDSLRVGLPEEPDAALIADLSDDALFVFASITRHENLTLAQLLATTQLPEGVVRHVLEKGRRMALLSCHAGGVYRLAVLYHYPLIRYLQAKHCLYE